VAATGWGAEADRDRAFAAGFDRHLTKPIEVDALQQIASSLE
jgi:CheY-like chemotaxis protein